VERQGALARRKPGDDLDSFREDPISDRTGVLRSASVIEFDDTDDGTSRRAVLLGYGEQEPVALIAA